MSAPLVTLSEQAEPIESTGLALVIERLAGNPAVDVAKLEKLIELQERILAHGAKQAFDDAFAALQAELPVVAAAKKGDKWKYAPLEDIIEAVRPMLARHGFSLAHRTEWPDKGVVRVVAVLAHRQGHERSSEFVSPADASGSKNAVQGLGSAISYGRRYTTQDVLGIVTRDEDDNAKKALAKPAPNGYDDWLADMAATADNGLKALQAAWGKSATDLKAHLAATDPDVWNELKKRAAKVVTS